MKPQQPEASEKDLSALFERQRRAARDGGPPACGDRLASLNALLRAIRGRVKEIVEAIDADYGGRSAHETLISEVFLTISALRHTRKNLKSWMRPERRRVDWMFLPGRARILRQPLGVVGIISPWNYPFYLALVPLISALAAGNRILLKPSEVTAHTAEILRLLLAETFREEQVAVVTGGPGVGLAFSRLPFDHIFFTGSASVGRSVLREASENLTPVTLELGGKSPAILGEDFRISTFAERVAAGKLFNAGQTCVAPDYVLAPRDRVGVVAEHLREAMTRYYPSFGKNPDFTAIINERHLERLRNLLDDAAGKGASVLPVDPSGEESAGAHGKFPPVLLLNVTEEMLVMQDEIFGPILPIRPHDGLEDVVEYINRRPRPLSLYYFDRDSRRIRLILERTVSGGACVNDTVIQAAQNRLPFGGVGKSGMGAYHGREGFDTFSHRKSVLHKSGAGLSGLLRPPYGSRCDRILKSLVGKEGLPARDR